MKRLLLASILLYSTLNAGGCILTQPKEMGIEWKAYKTLGKIGVGGKFTSIKYTPNALEGKNFRELLVGSKVEIDTTNIDTGNATRDETLVKYFFQKLSDTQIVATIKDIKADPKIKGNPRTGHITAMITMNKKSLIIPMRYSYKDGKFRAIGTIDLGDFEALPALATINKSCYDLHKGKTWRDVEIGFSTTIEATLCDSNVTKK